MAGTVAVALSGGVDSLTAAHLIQQRDADVVGLHFQTGYGGDTEPAALAEAARRLGISLEVIDFTEIFQSKVIAPFIREYRGGRTPNPCLVCNAEIKFGALKQAAEARGITSFATGHYARLKPGENGPRLFKGIDSRKDQSYFLGRVPRGSFHHTLFPLGGMTKAAVCTIAADKGIIDLADPESRDACFLQAGKNRDFLEQTGNLPRVPGDIVTTTGEIVGRHLGLHGFTVGQRRGIGVPGSSPYYVIRLEPEQNRLVVGFRQELSAKTCIVDTLNWLRDDLSFPLRVKTRIRYRHREAESTVTPGGSKNQAHVVFDVPQRAITPGQGAVFYDGEEVVGGGVISASL
jgi:tRNA-specific 2-thiouridylase